ncbi:hypothetical protein [Methylobacterium organophilum]|uniref:Uncharacterized protein n=1 Tax=Methylobacterium organophilum TaxID=410 RepID=A0ABQ4TCX9_METOR|nr:hypothetical protein [Methylobacterium organophilum]GJE29550.1 hypothetical protein LKMONMHP_4432 [Methylobacterium organophilum]
MRNPLKRLASREPGKPSLRERMAATREKFAQHLRVHRALRAPGPEAKPGGSSLPHTVTDIAPRAIELRPDPIFAVIEEARRLVQVHDRLLAVSGDKAADDPSQRPTDEAHAALWAHIEDVLLTTVPLTAAGCQALARFAAEFARDQGAPLVAPPPTSEPVLDLIARSPLL